MTTTAPLKDPNAPDLKRVFLPEARVAFEHVWTPSSPVRNATPEQMKYSCTFLIPKVGASLAEITAGMHAVRAEAYGNDKSAWPKLAMPYEDGDQPQYTNKSSPKFRDGYAGHWVFKASTNLRNQPGIVDEKHVKITDQNQFYSGCYARAWVYCSINKEFSKLHLILGHIKKTKDGPRFGGKQSLEQTFAPLSTGDVDDFGSGDFGGADTAAAPAQDDFGM